jgi:hypothetical protein
MQNDTEAGRAELPAYCRGIMGSALRPFAFLLATYVLQIRRRMQIAISLPPAHLKSTSRRHLLSEMVLVLADAAIPPSDSLVLTHHNVLCDLVE